MSVRGVRKKTSTDHNASPCLVNSWGCLIAHAQFSRYRVISNDNVQFRYHKMPLSQGCGGRITRDSRDRR